MALATGGPAEEPAPAVEEPPVAVHDPTPVPRRVVLFAEAHALLLVGVGMRGAVASQARNGAP